MIDAASTPATLPPGERLHPLFLLTGLGKSIRGAWGLFAGGAVLVTRNQWWLAAVLLGGFMLLSVGSLVLKWLKLEFRVGRDEIRIDTGLLNRTSRVIPFDRVTDIDIEQGPAHRLFGLAKVRFETGASAAAKSDDGVLEAVSLHRAEAIREHVRARRGGSSIEQADVDAARPPLFVMDKRRVALAGLFNFSLAIFAGLFGATQTLGNVVGFDPFKRSFWNRVLSEAGPLNELVLAHRFISVAAGILTLTTIGIVTGLVRSTLSDHGFRLDRTDTGLRRRRGLLTLTDVSVPQKRVQAAILANGPFRARFGWWTLKLQSLAQDGGQGDHVVAPLATIDEVASINASIGLPIGPDETSWRRVARAYVWAVAPIAVPAAIGALVGVTIGGPMALLLVPAGLAALVLRYAEWRHTRFALDGSTLFIERGWWRHRRLVLPVRRIQSIDIAENFWTRRLGYCALQLGIAGGNGLSVHAIPALTRVDAEALRGQLLTA